MAAVLDGETAAKVLRQVRAWLGFLIAVCLVIWGVVVDVEVWVCVALQVRHEIVLGWWWWWWCRWNFTSVTVISPATHFCSGPLRRAVMTVSLSQKKFTHSFMGWSEAGVLK
jgi:hypothetical protein